jgi:hypothetical protein
MEQFAVSYAIRNSGQLVVPRINAPAARSRATTTASSPDLALVQQAANLASAARGRNRRLDGHRQTMQCAARFSLRVEPARLHPHALGIEVSKCVELWIQPLDLLDVSLGQFSHGNLSRAQQLKLPRRRGQHNIVHGRVPGGDCGAPISGGADGNN